MLQICFLGQRTAGIPTVIVVFKNIVLGPCLSKKLKELILRDFTLTLIARARVAPKKP